jgi:AraC-like DNA-binding protein
MHALTDMPNHLSQLRTAVKYVYHRRRGADWNFGYSSRPFLTCWLVLSGARRVEVNGLYYNAVPGSLLLIPPNMQVYTDCSLHGPQSFEYLTIGVEVLYGHLPLHQQCDPPMYTQLDDSEAHSLRNQWMQFLDSWDRYIRRCSQPEVKATFDLALHELEVEGALRLLVAQIFNCSGPQSLSPVRTIDDRVMKVNQFMQQHIHERLNMQQLSALVYTSEGHLRLLFKASLNTSPMKHFLLLRLQKAKELLALSEQTITSIAAETGFDDVQHFNKIFRKYERTSPSQYRSQSRINM